MRRLRACGVRRITNVVDVTNYVMLELGQPLHAFDLDRLAGAEIVGAARATRARSSPRSTARSARSTPDDLVICDRDRRPGARRRDGRRRQRGADDDHAACCSRRASFDPATVRRTARRHGLHTEASHRFERGVDVEAGPAGAGPRRGAASPSWPAERCGAAASTSTRRRCAATVVRLSAGKWPPARGRGAGGGGGAHSRRAGLHRRRRGRARLVARPQLAAGRLSARGPGGGGRAHPRLRHHAGDASAADREPEARAGAGGGGATRARRARRSRLRRGGELQLRRPGALAAGDRASAGAARDARGGGDAEEPAQPPAVGDADLAVTRACSPTSPTTSDQGQEAVRLYEMGRIYLRDPEGGKELRPVAEEPLRVGGVLCGRGFPEAGRRGRDVNDFYDAKGAVEGVLSALGAPASLLSPARRAPVPSRAPAPSLSGGGSGAGDGGGAPPARSRKRARPAAGRLSLRARRSRRWCRSRTWCRSCAPLNRVPGGAARPGGGGAGGDSRPRSIRASFGRWAARWWRRCPSSTSTRGQPLPRRPEEPGLRPAGTGHRTGRCETRRSRRRTPASWKRSTGAWGRSFGPEGWGVGSPRPKGE